MFEKSFDISVILPIFNGGELFIDAILSIENSNIPFNNVFISFNGESDTDYQTYLKFKSENILKYSYVEFQTKKDLPSLAHGLFFQKEMRNFLKSDSTIFMLAHDDRIIPPNKYEFISLLNGVDLRSTVLFPSYSCCMADDYQHVIKMITKDEYISSENFFFRSLKENISTNISGMIMPFHVLIAASNSLNKLQSSGARFEHQACITNGIENVYFHNKLQILVGERPDSDGKLLTLRDHRISAFNYVRSFLINGQLKSPSKFPIFCYHLAKNWIGFLLYK